MFNPYEFFQFCFLIEEAMFSPKKKFEMLVSQYSEWSKTSRIFLADVRMYVCVYMLDFLIFKPL